MIRTGHEDSAVRREILPAQPSSIGPLVGVGHYSMQPLAGSMSVAHHGGPPVVGGHHQPLQQVSMSHVVQGITNHHVLSVTTLNKDQVSGRLLQTSCV